MHLQGEPRALARLVLAAHAAAARLENTPGRVEAEPDVAGLGSLEGLHQAAELLCGDAGPVVGHLERDGVDLGLGAEPHDHPRGGARPVALAGVGEERPERPGEARLARADGDPRRAQPLARQLQVDERCDAASALALRDRVQGERGLAARLRAVDLDDAAARVAAAAERH